MVKYQINSIEWHERNFENQINAYAQMKMQIMRMEKQADQLFKQAKFYELQIKEAKKEGRTHFDRERYRVKKI